MTDTPGSTVVLNLMEPIRNPSAIPPAGWDTTFENDTDPAWRFGAPMPGTLLPCGCHLRRPDYEAVLCANHLAELNGDHVTTQPTTEDLRDGMRVRRSPGHEFQTVAAVWPVGTNGARVEFTDGTTATVGRGVTWETEEAARG